MPNDIRADIGTNPKKIVKLKRNPSDGRAIVRISSTHADVIENPALLRTWDDEELEMGYRKDKDGKWRGRPPKVVPIECYQELVRRQLANAEKLLRHNLTAAVEALVGIMKSPFASDADRLRAVGMLMDRILGKPTERIAVEDAREDPEWMQVLKKAVVVGELPAEGETTDEISDADLVEQEK